MGKNSKKLNQTSEGYKDDTERDNKCIFRAPTHLYKPYTLYNNKSRK